MDILTNRQFLLLMAMLAAAVMLLGTAWMGDDAFITLRVIDNFVNGFGLRYNVIECVQVFTHPPWLLFLTPFYALTREAMVTTMLVSVLLSLGALWLLATRIAKNIEYGCLIVLAAMASRAICHFSTSGLENLLTFLLLALFVWQLYQAEIGWIWSFWLGRCWRTCYSALAGEIGSKLLSWRYSRLWHGWCFRLFTTVRHFPTRRMPSWAPGSAQCCTNNGGRSIASIIE